MKAHKPRKKMKIGKKMKARKTRKKVKTLKGRKKFKSMYEGEARRHAGRQVRRHVSHVST